MERRVRPRIGRLEILAGARVRQQRAGTREIMREEPIIIGEVRGVRGIVAPPAAQAAGARVSLTPKAGPLDETRAQRPPARRADARSNTSNVPAAMSPIRR